MNNKHIVKISTFVFLSGEWQEKLWVSIIISSQNSLSMRINTHTHKTKYKGVNGAFLSTVVVDDQIF